MKKTKELFLFCLGGAGYVGLELLWRGWSHSSMFLAGGCSFVLLGNLRKQLERLPLPFRGLACSGIITAVELAVGLIFNRDFQIWDYRGLPLNFLGQICLPFSALWFLLGLGAMEIYRRADQSLSRIASSLSKSSSRKPA